MALGAGEPELEYDRNTNLYTLILLWYMTLAAHFNYYPVANPTERLCESLSAGKL